MIITGIKRIEDAYSTPATADDDEMRLLHELGIGSIFEVTEVALEDGKVLGATALRLEGQRGHRDALYVLCAKQHESRNLCASPDTYLIGIGECVMEKDSSEEHCRADHGGPCKVKGILYNGAKPSRERPFRWRREWG